MTAGAAEATRDALVAILETAGLSPTPLPGGPWSAPATLLEGGSPWVTAGTLRSGSALVTYRIHVVPGRIDAKGSWAELTRRVDAVRAAIAAADGWRVGDTSAPTVIDTTQGSYLAAEVAASFHYTGG